MESESLTNTGSFEDAKATEAKEEQKKKAEQLERERKQMYVGDLVMKAILFVVSGQAANYEFPITLNGENGAQQKMIVSVRKGK